MPTNPTSAAVRPPVPVRVRPAGVDRHRPERPATYAIPRQSDRVSFRGDLLVVSRSIPGLDNTVSGSELWSLTTGRKVRSFGLWHLVTDDPRDGDLVAQTTAGGVLMVAALTWRPARSA